MKVIWREEDLIYKPQEGILPEKSNLGKSQNFMRSVGVLVDSFLDLGKTSHFQIIVEGELGRGRLDLQKPAVVFLEIEWFIFLVFFGFLLLWNF